MDLFIIRVPRPGIGCEHARGLTEVLWESCGILNVSLHSSFLKGRQQSEFVHMPG